MADTRPQTLNSLCTAIKVLVQKGDAAKQNADKHRRKSDDFYFDAGVRIIELKARHKAERINQPWAAYVKENCGFALSRAKELSRIAKRKTTVAETRAKNAAANRKFRARKRPSRDGRAKPGEGCDWEPTDQQQWDGEPYRVTRRRGFMGSCGIAIQQAQQNLFVVENRAEWAQLDPGEIDDQVISAAQRVIDEWTQCRETLKQLRKGENHAAAQAKAKASLEDRKALH